MPYPEKSAFPFAATPGATQNNALNFSGLGANQSIRDIAYGNNVFMAATDRGLYQSSDGINYTKSATFPDGNSNCTTIAFGGGYFYASNPGGTSIVRSADGSSWQTVWTKANGTGGFQASGFRYSGDGRWLAFAETFRWIVVSDNNGASWTAVFQDINNSGFAPP